MTQIEGSVEAGWGQVADAFRRNFEDHGEIGAACCVYADGSPVVDLWGGLADERTGRRWDDKTAAVVFSTTKGATAICAHRLVERGELDLDARVADYWPEFGQNGKETILVRWLLSHQAGLPGISRTLSIEEACAWEPVVRALEAERPLWEPGTRQAYHPLTYGFLVGEVIRRVSGKTVGAFFADEVASPLGLRAWIGIPEEQRQHVAHLHVEDEDESDVEELVEATLASLAGTIAIPDGAERALRDHFTQSDVAARLGGAFPPGLVTENGGHNLPLVHTSQHAATGLITDAHSLARMYAATIGPVGGVRILRPETVERMTVLQSAPQYGVAPEHAELMDVAFPIGVSLGFKRPTHIHPFIGPSSFGHPGAGGSIAFGDPEHHVGFGYVLNRMSSAVTRNNLVSAVANCIS